MNVCGGGKIRDEFAGGVRLDVQKRGDFIIERKPPDAPGHNADADKDKGHRRQIEAIGARCRDVAQRRATRIVVFGHVFEFLPGPA
jgi:hypothetical protein